MPSSLLFNILRRPWLWAPLLYVAIIYSVTALRPPPSAVALASPALETHNATFLVDESWLDSAGRRQLSQEIFDAQLSMIVQAESLILVDMFLYNAWQGPVRETHRALSSELTDALIARKRQRPALNIVVISDPINTVYGGTTSTHFDALRAAGIRVVTTDLTELQDSNPLYSGIWRWLIRPFGNARGDWLPNPFGQGRVSLRSYLTLANFKANHRKLLIADRRDGTLQALVTSANPHDGSSAHRNVALQFSGETVDELLAAEQALLSMSGHPAALADHAPAAPGVDTDADEANAETDTKTDANIDTETETKPASSTLASQTSPALLRFVNESRIKQAALTLLAATGAGDRVNLAMFYLADREVIEALKAARARGVDVRVLLDVNRDAFGRQKNGVPNRPVAAELVAHGLTVRWCETQGEQCHAKLLHAIVGQTHSLLLGSGNFTRRNLDDFNLETDVLLVGNVSHPAIAQSVEHFDRQWNNTASRTYSSAYERYADDSLWLMLQYRVMEATGISTF